MRKIKILWTDDEVEALKSHIFFLEEKGYEIDTCSNGNDTIDLVRQNRYDLIFLDENMPGLSGIETLKLIKEVRTDIPVVMITKSDEEDIMEAAIGSEIAASIISSSSLLVIITTGISVRTSFMSFNVSIPLNPGIFSSRKIRS